MKILVDGTALFDWNGAGIHVYAKNIIAELSSMLPFDSLHVGVRPSRWKYIAKFDYPYKVKKMVTFHLLGHDIGIVRDTYSCYHGLSNRVFRLLYPRGVKYIVTIHHLEYDEEVKRAIRFSSYVDAIVTVSHFAKEDIIRKTGLPPEKIHVIYNGVSSLFRPFSEEERIQLKRQWVEPDQKLIVLPITGGTVKNEKNIGEVVRHFARHHPQVCFLSFGIKSFPFIEHVGYVSESALIQLYNAADIVFFPAISGGFGLPVIEAMACGTPVVTSCNSAQSEIGGDAAWLANPMSPRDMIQAIETLLFQEFLRRELIKRGLERASQFRWEKAAKQLMDLYQSLLETNFL